MIPQILRILATTLAALAATPVQAQEKAAPTKKVAGYQFAVSKVDGDVAWLDSWTSSWFPAQPGAKIIPDTLIRLEPGSSISIDMTTGGQKSTFDIASDEISFIRLSPEIARQFTLKKASINFTKVTLPALNLGRSKSSKKQNPLAKAWERVTSVSSVSKSMTEGIYQNLSADKKENSLSMSLFQPTVKISYPRENGVLYVDKFPATIPVSWVLENNFQPINQKTFLTYIWPATAERNDPQAQTAGYLSFVTVTKAGLHRIQIEEFDGEYKSEELNFYVQSLSE